MASIELVIKIPKNFDLSKIQNGSIASQVILNAVKNGTPLPKGHGRLIDENKLKKEAIRCEWSRSAYDMLDHTLSYIKPIIDADKESD